MKLYPPYIEGKIPAFVKESTIRLTVPFQLNPLVGKNDFDKLVLVLKSISGEQLRGIIEARPYYVYEENNQDIHMGYADFIIPTTDTSGGWTTPINIGQYYKVQVAFKDGDNIGYYSSTGITKCIAKPACSIDNLQQDKVVANPFTFIGKYEYDTSKGDNEKLYSCRFDVYDDSYSLYDTSGEIIHSANKTDGKDTWELTKNLQPDKIYYIQYNYLTQNNYEGNTPKYPIMEGLFDSAGEWYKDLILKVEAKNESGKNVIVVEQPEKPMPVNGSYKIVRASSETNYKDWVDMFEFSVANWYITPAITWDDYFLTHGVKYKYALQRFNSKGVRLERGLETAPILADFEDMFLFDGKRQLRLAFNPKVSSFKTTILENKVDTLGGSYPFFYRNGNIAYKDFPISALISINMDENFDFLDEEKVNQLLSSEDGVPAPGRPSTPTNLSEAVSRTTMLTTDNVRIERGFKTEVLDWLNDGKFKLFRSPAEGNFLVRLMNVSLSPNDTLGRMIHTFNANAYEVGVSDIRSLLKREEFKPEVKALNIKASEDILLKEISQNVVENTHFLSLTVVGAGKPALDYVHNVDTNGELEEKFERINPVNVVYGKFTWKDLKSLPKLDPTDPNYQAYRITIDEIEQKRAYYNYVEKQPIAQDDFERKEPLALKFNEEDITSLADAYYIHSIEIEEFPENGEFKMITPTKQIEFTRAGIELVNARSGLCSILNPGDIPYKLHCYVVEEGA